MRILFTDTTEVALAKKLYERDFVIAKDNNQLFMNIEGVTTAIGDGDVLGATGATGPTGPTGATGATGASFAATATLTELGVSTAGCTGATGMVGATGGATLQELINAIAADIVLAQS